MRGFDSSLHLEQKRRRSWVVAKAFRFYGRDQVFRVHEGFNTDLASTPRLLWWLFPPFGSYSMAAVLHDLLWRRSKGLIDVGPLLDPADVDGVFRRAMRMSGTSFFVRWMMYSAVRWAAIFGGRKGSMGFVKWLQLLACTLAVLIPFVVVGFFVFGF